MFLFRNKTLLTISFDCCTPAVLNLFIGHSGFLLSRYGSTYLKRWDEWVPTDRLRKFNEENIAKQKQLHALSKQANASASSSSKAQKSANAASGRTSTAGRKEGARGTKRGREEVSRNVILHFAFFLMGL